MKVMTPEELQRNDRFFLLMILAGGYFLGADFVHAAAQGTASAGWAGFLASPIFTHKVSEVLLLGMWLPVAWMGNYRRAGLWPHGWTAARYRRLLRTLQMLALPQIALAVHAWVVINLGGHPLASGPEAWVWRYYLGAVALGGVIFLPVVRRLLRGLEGEA